MLPKENAKKSFKAFLALLLGRPCTFLKYLYCNYNQKFFSLLVCISNVFQLFLSGNCKSSLLHTMKACSGQELSFNGDVPLCWPLRLTGNVIPVQAWTGL